MKERFLDFMWFMFLMLLVSLALGLMTLEAVAEELPPRPEGTVDVKTGLVCYDRENTQRIALYLEDVLPTLQKRLETCNADRGLLENHVNAVETEGGKLATWATWLEAKATALENENATLATENEKLRRKRFAHIALSVISTLTAGGIFTVFIVTK